MKLLLSLVLGFCSALAPSATHAAVAMSTIVDCTTISGMGPPFEACATASYESPSPANIDGQVVYMGGYKTTYTMVKGLQEGTDTTTLSEEASKEAYSLGLVVTVQRDDQDVCGVTVSIKSNSTKCSSCTYCGSDKYTADCTNLKGGRTVTCESAAAGDVYFPIKPKPVKAPTAGAVGAPKGPMSPKAAPKANAAPKAAPKAKAPRAPKAAPKTPVAPKAPKTPVAPKAPKAAGKK